MITINNIEMPKSCADCKFCINEVTNDYGSFGECLLHKYKKVNCLIHSRDDDCPLCNTKQIITDTDGNAEILVYKNGKEDKK